MKKNQIRKMLSDWRHNYDYIRELLINDVQEEGLSVGNLVYNFENLYDLYTRKQDVVNLSLLF
jgi:hypothetical protein